MVSTSVDAGAKPPFPARHPWDAIAWPAFTAVAWLGVIAGFGPEIARHVVKAGFSYPLIVHLHAAAFVGWLVLFTVQVALVRTGRASLHRRLGLGGGDPRRGDARARADDGVDRG